jgi:alcohol dehydrogenase (cytochrome c)
MTTPTLTGSRSIALVALTGALAWGLVHAQAPVANRPAVTFDRLTHADAEPQNWLTYSGSLNGWRHSRLDQITPENVRNLELAWQWETETPGGPLLEMTPLVVDGVIYTVHGPNDVYALDAATGRERWTFRYTPTSRPGGYRSNRGLAILGNTLFVGTADAHLLAIDAQSGTLLWDTPTADSEDPLCGDAQCYSITHAPLVVKNMVIVGPAGGEGRIRGFIAAFDAATGREVWRFHTIPAPGEAGSETWADDSWKTGGAPVWNTGTYDPDLNLTYWGTGNPGLGNQPGADLLYSESVVALDADTGQLKWHYQFTPRDNLDWDATQIPVLVDLPWRGQERKLMLFANRNGLYYVLDRATGEFLVGKPFAEVNWMSGFDDAGRPLRTGTFDIRQQFGAAGTVKPGPGELGATNWYPPSYSPATGLFYVPSFEYRGSPRYGAMRALDPVTGERRWEFRQDAGGALIKMGQSMQEAGVFFKVGALTTTSGLLFTGVLKQGSDGHEFYALDARTGELLWTFVSPQPFQAGAMTYAVDGRQYVAVASFNTLFAFSLPQ